MHEPAVATDEPQIINNQIPVNAALSFENLNIPMANTGAMFSQGTAKSMHQRFAENSGVRGTILWDL